jgi:hypothetical protein
MPKLSVDVVSEIPRSKCLDCGTSFRVALGPLEAVPGAFMLCSACASLHVLDGNRIARRPTAQEQALAATSQELAEWRELILAAPFTG